ncbi:glycosyltransferase family 39 protein [Clostridium sp. KNHs216]|uniref:ArnT family glycosyltransferase n=1 Tax=Clostridium sp. KNHs216 TaxID=1550235 RepID=UPI0011518A2F|nr:glycosyltransferase family 39 protein [Clostridium sp. KNHs216]TQI65780.1 dolichyl-phosphate-mannose-protein mannosyltransferase [Clostridium sp. KNHs216]
MQHIIVKFRKKPYIPALILIAALSFTLNFYAISNYGTGNEYYAACVKSMTLSFKNFFFVSFDPAGMVSVDKPPLGLWTQAISVLIFGYHGWAMLLPQALAGAASTVMIYILTARYFGRPAGLVSALIFAITPVVVVASRNNTMDMQLIFVLLAAAWFLFRSIDSGRWKYLFLAALFVGLGFNIKMLQAYMILPAVALTYLFFAKEKIGKRILAGILSMVIVLAVSFAWVLAVEFYPSEDRPYVDSTSSNSMIELIFGHNGTERLFGQSMGGGMGGGFSRSSDRDASGSAPQMNDDGNGTPPDGYGQGAPDSNTNGSGQGMPGGNADGNGQGTSDGAYESGQNMPDGGADGRGDRQDGGRNMGANGMGGSEIGNASPLRLWTSNLYGQGSWFLLFALCSMLLCVNKWNFRRKNERQGAFVFWSLWLITMAVFFSFAGFYHRYYLCMMAPAIAVLSGVGIVTIYNGLKHRREKKTEYLRPVLLLAAFLLNLALQIVCVLRYSELKTWLLPVMLAAAGVGILLFAVYCVRHKRGVLAVSLVVLVLSSVAAPFYWALTPVMGVTNSTMPYAGPELLQSGQGNGTGMLSDNGSSQSSSLEAYLVKNYKEGSFLVTAQRSSSVAQFIIDTGLPCYAYGGFLGSDNSLTVDQLKTLVAEGKITYFLLSGSFGSSGSSGSDIESYVKENAVLVDSGEYSSNTSNVGQMGGQGGTLYLFQS